MFRSPLRWTQDMGGQQKSTEKRFEGEEAGAAAEQLPRCQLQAAQLGMILCGSSVVGGGGSCTLLLAAAGLDTGRVNSHTDGYSTRS